MTLTISQMIEAISDYSVSTDITSTRLTALQQVVAGDLSRMDPGFSGDDLTELEAYLVLDRFETRNSDDNIESEKIKDHTWKFRASSSSSSWMDKALFKISQYNQNVSSCGCVEHADSVMSSMAADMIEIEKYYDS